MTLFSVYQSKVNPIADTAGVVHVYIFVCDEAVLRQCREAAEAVVGMNGVPDGAMQQQPMITDAAAAGQALPAGGEPATGWAEQGMQIDDHGGAGQLDDMVAAKFKPGIKFKLGM